MYAYQVVLLNILIAPASPPTGLSVVWDPPSAVVRFQSPVYGGECVDHYVVTAVREERSVSCVETMDRFTHVCHFLLDDSDVNKYNFSAYAVTRGIDGILYNGSIATDCSKLRYNSVFQIVLQLPQ